MDCELIGAAIRDLSEILLSMIYSAATDRGNDALTYLPKKTVLCKEGEKE